MVSEIMTNIILVAFIHETEYSVNRSETENFVFMTDSGANPENFQGGGGGGYRWPCKRWGHKKVVGVEERCAPSSAEASA